MSRLLINEQPLLVLPSLACEIGLNEALMLQQIHYWMNTSKNYFEGRHWVYNSVSDWQSQFPFWSESTIKRALTKLEKLALVNTGDFNSDAWDKTKWYSINYDNLDKLSGVAKSMDDRLGQIDQIDNANMTKASGQNDQSPQVKMTQSPTENTTDNKDLDPPYPQKGEGEEIILADAKKALQFYNDSTGTRCRDVKPFVLMLTPTQTREGYTLADLQLVIRWVLATWRRRGAGLPKPSNICRVNRFDGYLADAEAWATTEASIDPVAVMDGYNEIFDGVLPAAALDNDRRRLITRLAAHMVSKTTGAFMGYFEKFLNSAPEYYFGGENRDGWRASFDYLMKPETLRNTREGSL